MTAPPQTLDEIYRYIIVNDLDAPNPSDVTLGTLLLAMGAALKNVVVNEGPLSMLDPRVGGVEGAGNDNAAAFDRATALLDNGGEFSIPEGVWQASVHTSPTDGNYKTIFAVPSNVKMSGFGPGTIIQPLGSQPAANAFIINAHPTAGTDHDITFEDFVIDGLGASQSGTDYQNGITVIRGRRYKHRGVVVKNTYGTGSVGAPAENSGFTATLCADVDYTDCDAIDDSGTMSDGFSSNSATNINRKGCTAYGMSASMGFADFQSAGIIQDACYAYLCHLNGYNAENCADVQLLGGRYGGEASAFMDGSPFTASQSLACGQAGVVLNSVQHFALMGVMSRFNPSNLILVDAYSTGTSGAISGGSYSDGQFGIGVHAASIYGHVFADSMVECLRNSTANLDLENGGPGFTQLHGIIGTPSFPASGTPVTNVYLTPVTIYVSGVSLSFIDINGSSFYPAAPTVIRLLPGNTVTLNYSGSGSWAWYVD